MAAPTSIGFKSWLAPTMPTMDRAFFGISDKHGNLVSLEELLSESSIRDGFGQNDLQQLITLNDPSNGEVVVNTKPMPKRINMAKPLDKPPSDLLDHYLFESVTCSSRYSAFDFMWLLTRRFKLEYDFQRYFTQMAQRFMLQPSNHKEGYHNRDVLIAAKVRVMRLAQILDDTPDIDASKEDDSDLAEQFRELHELIDKQVKLHSTVAPTFARKPSPLYIHNPNPEDDFVLKMVCRKFAGDEFLFLDAERFQNTLTAEKKNSIINSVINDPQAPMFVCAAALLLVGDPFVQDVHSASEQAAHTAWDLFGNLVTSFEGVGPFDVAYRAMRSLSDRFSRFLRGKMQLDVRKMLQLSEQDLAPPQPQERFDYDWSLFRAFLQTANSKLAIACQRRECARVADKRFVCVELLYRIFAKSDFACKWEDESLLHYSNPTTSPVTVLETLTRLITAQPIRYEEPVGCFYNVISKPLKPVYERIDHRAELCVDHFCNMSLTFFKDKATILFLFRAMLLSGLFRWRESQFLSRVRDKLHQTLLPTDRQFPLPTGIAHAQHEDGMYRLLFSYQWDMCTTRAQMRDWVDFMDMDAILNRISDSNAPLQICRPRGNSQMDWIRRLVLRSMNHVTTFEDPSDMLYYFSKAYNRTFLPQRITSSIGQKVQFKWIKISMEEPSISFTVTMLTDSLFTISEANTMTRPIVKGANHVNGHYVLYQYDDEVYLSNEYLNGLLTPQLVQTKLPIFQSYTALCHTDQHTGSSTCLVEKVGVKLVNQSGTFTLSINGEMRNLYSGPNVLLRNTNDAVKNELLKHWSWVYNVPELFTTYTESNVRSFFIGAADSTCPEIHEFHIHPFRVAMDMPLRAKNELYAAALRAKRYDLAMALHAQTTWRPKESIATSDANVDLLAPERMPTHLLLSTYLSNGDVSSLQGIQRFTDWLDVREKWSYLDALKSASQNTTILEVMADMFDNRFADLPDLQIDNHTRGQFRPIEWPDQCRASELDALLLAIATLLDQIDPLQPIFVVAARENVDYVAEHIRDTVGVLFPLSRTYVVDRTTERPPGVCNILVVSLPDFLYFVSPMQPPQIKWLPDAVKRAKVCLVYQMNRVSHPRACEIRVEGASKPPTTQFGVLLELVMLLLTGMDRFTGTNPSKTGKLEDVFAYLQYIESTKKDLLEEFEFDFKKELLDMNINTLTSHLEFQSLASLLMYTGEQITPIPYSFDVPITQNGIAKIFQSMKYFLDLSHFNTFVDAVLPMLPRIIASERLHTDGNLLFESRRSRWVEAALDLCEIGIRITNGELLLMKLSEVLRHPPATTTDDVKRRFVKCTLLDHAYSHPAQTCALSASDLLVHFNHVWSFERDLWVPKLAVTQEEYSESKRLVEAALPPVVASKLNAHQFKPVQDLHTKLDNLNAPLFLVAQPTFKPPPNIAIISNSSLLKNHLIARRIDQNTRCIILQPRLVFFDIPHELFQKGVLNHVHIMDATPQIFHFLFSELAAYPEVQVSFYTDDPPVTLNAIVEMMAMFKRQDMMLRRLQTMFCEQTSSKIVEQNIMTGVPLDVYEIAEVEVVSLTRAFTWFYERPVENDPYIPSNLKLSSNLPVKQMDFGGRRSKQPLFLVVEQMDNTGELRFSILNSHRTLLMLQTHDNLDRLSVWYPNIGRIVRAGDIGHKRTWLYGTINQLGTKISLRALVTLYPDLMLSLALAGRNASFAERLLIIVNLKKKDTKHRVIVDRVGRNQLSDWMAACLDLVDQPEGYPDSLVKRFQASLESAPFQLSEREATALGLSELYNKDEQVVKWPRGFLPYMKEYNKLIKCVLKDSKDDQFMCLINLPPR